MKTAELLPPLLDLWVGRAEGRQARIDVNECLILLPQSEHRGLGDQWHVFEPSSRPDHGHPIIERDKIGVFWADYGDGGDKWRAGIDMHGYTPEFNVAQSHGPAALIAAMRAKVASVFGEEVPDETDIG